MQAMMLLSAKITLTRLLQTLKTTCQSIGYLQVTEFSPITAFLTLFILLAIRISLMEAVHLLLQFSLLLHVLILFLTIWSFLSYHYQLSMQVRTLLSAKIALTRLLQTLKTTYQSIGYLQVTELSPITAFLTLFILLAIRISLMEVVHLLLQFCQPLHAKIL